MMAPALTASAHGELRQLINRAATTLLEAATAADVLDARDQAAFAYDAAKAVGRLARAKGAHDELLSRAYRAQADAAEIEYLAKKRLADEYDAAQARGEVGLSGARTDLVPQGNEVVPTAADIGLSRKDVFEARQIRDAIADNPAIVREVLDDLLERGEEPTKAALKRALKGIAPAIRNTGASLGTKSRTKEERGNNAYFTPIEAMRVILALESFSAIVKEPACGCGHASGPMEEAGYGVMLSDLIDYGTSDRDGVLQHVGDFLDSRAGDSEGIDIVTNPPYGRDILNRFVAHALREHKPRKMALLMNINVLCGCEDPDRIFFMEEQPPSRIYIFTRRLPMMHQHGWDGPESTSQMNTAWYVWEQNEDGTYGDGYPRLIRVDYEKFADAEPLTPGAGGFASPSMYFVSNSLDEDEDLTRSTPRYSDAERVEMDRARAMIWMADRETFTAKEFQVGLAVRPRVGAAIVETFLGEGLLDYTHEGDLRLTQRAHLALAAASGALLAGMTPADVEAFGEVAHA